MHENFFHNLKVYYEDTDSGGIVYYANYLKFFERARSEALYSVGLSNKQLKDDYKTQIIVKSCNIEYKKPAKLEDQLEIISTVKKFTKISFKIFQKVIRDKDEICCAELIMVTINLNGKPVKIPEILKNSL